VKARLCEQHHGGLQEPGLTERRPSIERALTLDTEEAMKTLKIVSIALATLALSSAAMAHGWERASYHERGHERARVLRCDARRDMQPVVYYTDRYAPRYQQPRCAAPVVYVQPRANIGIGLPGVHVNLNFGL
jgi:hypothetical protein